MPRTKQQIADYQRAYRAKNAEAIAKQRKLYRQTNAEVVRSQKLAYSQANRDEILKRKKQYYEKNREQILERQKANRLATLDEKRAAARDRYHRTKAGKIEMLRAESRKRQPQNNELKKARNKERRKSDPMFLLIERIRNRTALAIKERGWRKTTNTTAMLGCSKEEFLRHIESQFLPGMNWSNREKWHIDHIVPLASAQTVSDLERLAHFSNLRPLWAWQNLQKGSKHERKPCRN